jgi:hypothetical protein
MKMNLLEAIKFNLDCYDKGIITKEDLLQAVEEELNFKI